MWNQSRRCSACGFRYICRSRTVSPPSDKNVTAWFIWHSLRFEHLEQTAFGLGVVAIYKAEAFRRFIVLGHTFAHDHLEPSFGSRLLVFCMDITAVDSNDQRCGGIPELIPGSLASAHEDVLLPPIRLLTVGLFGVPVA